MSSLSVAMGTSTGPHCDKLWVKLMPHIKCIIFSEWDYLLLTPLYRRYSQVPLGSQLGALSQARILLEKPSWDDLYMPHSNKKESFGTEGIFEPWGRTLVS